MLGVKSLSNNLLNAAAALRALPVVAKSDQPDTLFVLLLRALIVSMTFLFRKLMADAPQSCMGQHLFCCSDGHFRTRNRVTSCFNVVTELRKNA